MTDDLVAFLRARVAEDEQIARAAEGEHVEALVSDAAHAHLTRWGPARVLADVEAKRQIIAEYGQAAARADSEPDPGVREEWEIIASTRESVLCLLALPYVEHPDYRAEWSPTEHEE